MVNITSDLQITQTELCHRLGVAQMTIRNWENNKDFDEFIGPFPVGVKVSKQKMYNWRACLTWYVKYTIFTEYKELFKANDGAEDWKEVKLKEDALKARIDRQTKELELAEAQGLVAPVAELESRLSEAVLLIRQKLLTLTPRLTVLLQLTPDQKDAVEAETRRTLSDLANLS